MVNNTSQIERFSFKHPALNSKYLKYYYLYTTICNMQIQLHCELVWTFFKRITASINYSMFIDMEVLNTT